MNNATINSHEPFLCGLMFPFLLDLSTGMGTWNCWIKWWLFTFEELPNKTNGDTIFIFPIAEYVDSNFLISLSKFVIIWSFGSSLPSGFDVLPHCNLICMPLINNVIEHFFMCILTIFISSIDKYLFRYLAYF